MKLSQSTSILLVILTAITLVGVGLAFATVRLNAQVGLLQKDVDQQTVDQTRYFELADQYAAFADSYQNWARLLPASEAEVAVFAAIVEQQAKTRNLTLNLHFEDFPELVDTQGKYLAGLKLTVSLEGSYQDSTAFINDLTKLPYFFRVDKLILTQDEIKKGIKTTLQGYLFMNVSNIPAK
jgi:Tfp pilus assembly protein PilO